MDLIVGNYSTKGTFTIMNDKDDHISLGNDFEPFEPLETHLLSRECKLPSAKGGWQRVPFCRYKSSQCCDSHT